VVSRGRLDRLPIGGRDFHDLAGWQYRAEIDRPYVSALALSKDGAQVYGILRNTGSAGSGGEGAQWQLYLIDVKTGAEKMLAPIDLPASTDAILGLQPASRWQALPHIHLEAAVRYLDAGRLGSAAEDLARPAVAAVMAHPTASMVPPRLSVYGSCL
jgi:hypothetical protein